MNEEALPLLSPSFCTSCKVASKRSDVQRIVSKTQSGGSFDSQDENECYKVKERATSCYYL